MAFRDVLSFDFIQHVLDNLENDIIIILVVFSPQRISNVNDQFTNNEDFYLLRMLYRRLY
jgi:hypothetical protein